MEDELIKTMEIFKIENRYISYELQIMQLNKRIAYLERSIERKDDTIIELELERVPYTNEYIDKINKENEDLKRQLNYLRSGEYYNQLRFENQMLQQVVDTNGVPSEVYDYLESVHKNTEFLEQQQVFIKYLEDINSFETIGNILSKYKEIIGGKINEENND